MRGCLRFLLVVFACLFVAPTTAFAAERTLVFRTHAIRIGPYDTARAVIRVPAPKTRGYVVAMNADVVDARGRQLSIHDVMLHHIVFQNLGVSDATCSGFLTRLPERFYGTSEEHARLKLPKGYGYPYKGSPGWEIYYMLMNHHNRTSKAYIKYTVRYATGIRMKPVRPFWLDVRNCHPDPQFSAPGDGGSGSFFRRAWTFRMPLGGRFVYGYGHLHGGAVRLELDNTTCNQHLFTSYPTWGGAWPLPLLHEPGPAHMSHFSTTKGIPVAAGSTLRLRAIYDDSLPHTRVMGIMLVYLAPGSVLGCPAVPPLPRDLQSHPAPPPRVVLPLVRQPKGPIVKNVHQTWVGDYKFGNEKVQIPAGTTFRWNFVGKVEHDVTLANGPVGFASDYTLRGMYSYHFTKPGTYNLFCSIHPALMSMRVIVTPSSARTLASAGGSIFETLHRLATRLLV